MTLTAIPASLGKRQGLNGGLRHIAHRSMSPGEDCWLLEGTDAQHAAYAHQLPAPENMLSA